MRERASAGFVALYAFAYASLWLALLTPPTITLALRIRQLAPQSSARAMSVVLFAGALVALVSNPVLGALSDRTRSRFGRRRPWLIGGSLCGLVALAVIGTAQSVSAVLLGWCFAQLAYNAVLAALVAIVPDRIPSGQRGSVVGILGMCMPVGQIVGTFLVKELSPNMFLALIVPGIVGILGVFTLALALPEVPAFQLSDPVPGANGRSPDSRRAFVRRHRDFAWTWVNRVMFMMGWAFLQSYQPYYLFEKLRAAESEVTRVIFHSTLVYAVMTVIWSVTAGKLSDRLARRKPFAIGGSVIQGIGLWLIAVSDSYASFLIAVGVASAGYGIFEGVNLALVTEVLPDRQRTAAKDLGLLNIANTLPQVVVPLAAPFILGFTAGDYSALFVVAGATVIAGCAFLIPLSSVR